MDRYIRFVPRIIANVLLEVGASDDCTEVGLVDYFPMSACVCVCVCVCVCDHQHSSLLSNLHDKLFFTI